MATPYPNENESNYDEIQMIQLPIILDAKKDKIFTLIGQSIAASRTSIIIPELGLCFDYGFCSLIGTQQSMVLITHGHADHIGSLHFHAFERKLHVMECPTYFMPGVYLPDFIAAYDAYHRLGGSRSTYEGRMNPIGINLNQMGTEIATTPKGRYLIKPYQMKHSIPTIGYLIVEKRSKLKEEYLAFPPKEIGKLVKSGADVTYQIEIPWIAFTGDTTFQGLLNNPIFFQAKILIVECTFLGLIEEDTQSFAKKRSHIHIKDFEDHLELFQNEIIVLCHFSRRYKKPAILAKVAELDQKFNDRLKVLPFI